MNDPAIVVGMIFSWIVGMLMGAWISYDKIEDFYYDAAQTECAQFNPQSGEFEWIDDIERIIKEIDE